MRHNLAMGALSAFFLTLGSLHAQAKEDQSVSARQQLKEDQRELLYGLAVSLEKEDKVGEAISLYNQYLDLYPRGRRVYEIRATLARIYEARQYFAKAARIWLAMYRDAGIASQSLNYYFEYGRLQEMGGELAEAEKVYREINQLSPESDAAEKARLKLQALNLFGEVTPPVHESVKGE